VGYKGAQVFTLQKLHHQIGVAVIGVAVLIAEVVDRDDIRMLQFAHTLGFTIESLQELGVIGKPYCHHLDGDLMATRRPIPGSMAL